MKLTVLSENNAGQHYLAEHGLSYLIESDGHTVLFDTGASDVFLQNAERLNINLSETVDTLVLSHGHWDHGNGLPCLSNKRLVTHPDAFMKRYHKGKQINLGLNLSKKEIEERFRLETSEKALQLSSNIYFLGAIPRNNDFEAQETNFVTEDGEPDFIPDDSGLAIIENDLLILITGCAHSGICNMLEHAIKITGIKKVKAIIGGTHLKLHNKVTDKTIAFLEAKKVEDVYATHCTGIAAMCEFHKTFGNKLLKTGDTLKI